MALDSFNSEGSGSGISASSISDQFNNLASGLQSMIPGAGPAPDAQQSYDVAINQLQGPINPTNPNTWLKDVDTGRRTIPGGSGGGGSSLSAFGPVGLSK